MTRPSRGRERPAMLAAPAVVLLCAMLVSIAHATQRRVLPAFDLIGMGGESLSSQQLERPGRWLLLYVQSRLRAVPGRVGAPEREGQAAVRRSDRCCCRWSRARSRATPGDGLPESRRCDVVCGSDVSSTCCPQVARSACRARHSRPHARMDDGWRAARSRAHVVDPAKLDCAGALGAARSRRRNSGC